MRQSIITRYIGPTRVRGPRVSATSSGGKRIAIEWDDALNSDQNHSAAACALASKLGWSGVWHGGSLGDRAGCVFVQPDGDGFAVTNEQRAA